MMRVRLACLSLCSTQKRIARTKQLLLRNIDRPIAEQNIEEVN